jgi:hypothetical protein
MEAVVHERIATSITRTLIGRFLYGQNQKRQQGNIGLHVLFSTCEKKKNYCPVENILPPKIREIL